MAPVEHGLRVEASGVAEFESERTALLAQLIALEGQPQRPSWPLALIAIGLLLIIGLTYHGSLAYATLHAIDQRSNLVTPNPAALFSEIAATGPRVGSAVDNSSRPAYGKALEQYVVDGTGVGLGLMLVFGGLFVRLNH